MAKRNSMNTNSLGEKSKPRVPTDLDKALAATPETQASWTDITAIARRDWISWIDSAKLIENT